MDQELKEYLAARFDAAGTRFGALEKALVDLKTDLNTRVENLSLLIADVKKSLEREVVAANLRLDLIENRLDRIDTRQTGMDITLSGISRSLAGDGKLASVGAATQSAQQRAINDLAARLRRLEDERKAS